MITPSSPPCGEESPPFLNRYGEACALCVLMVLALGFRLYHLPGYPLHEDELITLSALQGILASGVPQFADGSIYWRALLPHYLMVVPLLFTDATIMAARLVPTLFSVLLIPVAYAGGRMLSGRAAGWLAAGFLAFSAYQNHHAAFARFYLPFQFFFLAAALLAGSYFIHGRARHAGWLLAAILATLASHALAVTLLPLLGLAFLFGRRWELLRSWRFWGAVMVVAVFTWLNIFWEPDQAVEANFSISLMIGGLVNKWIYYEKFSKYLPYGWTLILLGLLPLYLERSRFWGYLLFGFISEILFLSLVTPDPNVRYLCHIFPLGVLLAAASLGWYGGQLLAQMRGGGRPWLKREYLVGGVVVLLAGGQLVFAGSLDPRTGFGNYIRFHDQQPAHAFLAGQVAPQDIVISLDPGMSEYLIKRPVNYFLREKYDPATKSYSAYDSSTKGGNPGYYIDSPERLQAVLESTRQRIWIYLNHKVRIATSDRLRDLLEQKFVTVFTDEQMQTYVLVRY